MLKTTKRYYFISMRMAIIKKTDSVGKNMEKSEYLYVDENVKWYTRFGKVWQSLKMLSISPAIPFLDIYPKEIKSSPYKNMHMNVHSSIIQNTQKL